MCFVYQSVTVRMAILRFQERVWCTGVEGGSVVCRTPFSFRINHSLLRRRIGLLQQEIGNVHADVAGFNDQVDRKEDQTAANRNDPKDDPH